MHMGWLRLVGSLKLQVCFAECSLFYRAFLQKRPTILRSLLIVATPYEGVCMSHIRFGNFLPSSCIPHICIAFICIPLILIIICTPFICTRVTSPMCTIVCRYSKDKTNWIIFYETYEYIHNVYIWIYCCIRVHSLPPSCIPLIGVHMGDVTRHRVWYICECIDMSIDIYIYIHIYVWYTLHELSLTRHCVTCMSYIRQKSRGIYMTYILHIYDIVWYICHIYICNIYVIYMPRCRIYTCRYIYIWHRVIYMSYIIVW